MSRRVFGLLRSAVSRVDIEREEECRVGDEFGNNGEAGSERLRELHEPLYALLLHSRAVA